MTAYRTSALPQTDDEFMAEVHEQVRRERAERRIHVIEAALDGTPGLPLVLAAFPWLIVLCPCDVLAFVRPLWDYTLLILVPAFGIIYPALAISRAVTERRGLGLASARYGWSVVLLVQSALGLAALFGLSDGWCTRIFDWIAISGFLAGYVAYRRGEWRPFQPQVKRPDR